MKRYNYFNSQWVLLGIIAPILVFFLAMNSVYAYFTATTTQKQTSNTTSIIQIGFTDATNATINSVTVTENTKILPGQTIQINGGIKNTGSASFYALIEICLYITKVGGTETIIQSDVYTITQQGLKQLEFSDEQDKYTTEACALNYNTTTNVGESINFSTSYEFGFYEYDNTYQGATFRYSITAYAIQKFVIEDAVEATNLIAEQITSLS
ncbi:MAG: hypothetical protein IKM43_04225 [Clostridia bacterium]|nr:hypothetical protein [Clostridia bacterium]